MSKSLLACVGEFHPVCMTDKMNQWFGFDEDKQLVLYERLEDLFKNARAFERLRAICKQIDEEYTDYIEWRKHLHHATGEMRVVMFADAARLTNLLSIHPRRVPDIQFEINNAVMRLFKEKCDCPACKRLQEKFAHLLDVSNN